MTTTPAAVKSKIDWDELRARAEHPEDFIGGAVAATHPDAPWNIFRQLVQICNMGVRR
jgi:hypothetical protein